jgi:exo-rhamnogalacturonan lyase-like protein
MLRSRNAVLSAVMLALLVAPVCGAGASVYIRRVKLIPLKVTEPAGVARVNAPVSGGVPVGPLGLKDIGLLRLIDSKGKKVSAQISPMVTREDGVLDWVLVDFATDLKPKETKTFALAAMRGRAYEPVKNSVETMGTNNAVVVTNRLVEIRLSKKKFNLFETVKVGGKEILSAEAPAALSIMRAKDRKVFTARDGVVEKVTLEDAGPFRATVRIDGTFGDGKGGTWLGYTVRVTMWAANPEIRVLYAIRNVNPKVAEAAHIRQASVTLKLAGSGNWADYVVGANKPHMSRVSKGPKFINKGSQWHHTVELAQVGPSEPVISKSHRRFHHLVKYEDAGYRVIQHQPGRRKQNVDVGFKCDGWLDAMTDKAGCRVWLRNFTHDNPKRLTAKADGTMSVDLIPVYEGKGQPYYADGGYWLGDRSHRTYELNFLFHTDPTVTDADRKAQDRQFQNYMAIRSANVAKLVAGVQRACRPLQLVSTPEWYTKAGGMWGVVPSLDDEWAAAKAMGRKTKAPLRHLDAGELLATEFIHYENFHYRSEWDGPRDALLEFLRTGTRHYLTRAHSYARNYRDLGVLRTDGLALAGRAAGNSKRGVAAIPRWGKFCGCHNYGAGIIDMWLITGDRSYRDAGVEYGYVHAADPKPYGGFGMRHWGRRMASVLRTWQVTRDPKLKAWLLKNCKPRIPDDEMRADGRALICGKNMSSWMVGLCSHAIWHNWVANKDEYKGIDRDDYRDQLIGMSRQVAKYWWFDHVNGGPYHFAFDKPKPGVVTTNGGGGPYTLSCVDMITRGYLLSGDPKLLAGAKKFWNACNASKDDKVLVARLEDIEGMGSHTYWARQIVYELAHPRKDAMPPTKIADLAVTALGGGKVRLTWTAPKDNTGVVAYQVKHAPCPIVNYEDYAYPRDHNKKWTWWAGYNVAGEPKPGKPGAKETMVIDGVPAGTRYIAIRSRDAAPNESPISNVVRLDVR